jgi:hypothetical protein
MRVLPLPSLHSPGQVQHFTPTPLLVLDYFLLFFLFSFVGGSFRGCAGLCSWQCLGKWCVVCDSHLFILQIHASSFGAHQWVEMVLLFSFGCFLSQYSIAGPQDGESCSLQCCQQAKIRAGSGCCSNTLSHWILMLNGSVEVADDSDQTILFLTLWQGRIQAEWV